MQVVHRRWSDNSPAVVRWWSGGGPVGAGGGLVGAGGGPLVSKLNY